MPAGLTEPAGAAPPAGVSASGTVTMAPAGTLPVRVESTPVALGAVTKAPVSVCVESTVSQPLRPPVGTLVTKVASVSALPKLSSGPPLPAPQIVAVKAPNTTTIQLPANLQLPPGTVLIKSNSGQLMLVSPQQAVTRAETTTNITSRPAIPTNTHTVKICTVPNSGSQLVKKVAVAPVKKLAQIGTTVVTTVPKPSSVQSVAVPTASVVTVTPGKPLNSVTTLKPSNLGASPALSNDPSLKAENSAAAQANLSPAMLENVKKCKNFLAMLIKLACSGSQSPEMGQNVKKLVEQLLDAKIEAEEFTRQLYVELKSSPQPHLVPFLKKSVIALRQLMPNSQSFIQQCVQQTCSEVVIATCTTTAATSPVVTTTVCSIQPEKPIIVSGTTTASTVSVPALNPLAGPGGAKPGVVTLHSLGPPAAPGGTAAGTVLLQTPKPLVTSIQNTVTTVSLPPEKPAVSGAAVTLALPAVTFGEPSAAAVCLPSVKPVMTSAGTTSDKPVIAPVQIKLAPPGPVLSQPAGIPQAVKVKQLVVQQPSGGVAKQVTTLPHSSALTIQKSGQKKMPVSTAIPASQFPPASILKQITLPGNKILSLQASPIQKNKVKENGITSFRDEDDINDVASMAGVNLSEENACILATNSDLVGTLVQSCKDEPFLFIGALQKRILDIGKKHDITELNSDAVNLISHATQERLRGLLEKLTTIAQHRMTTYKASENYILSSDTRSQLKFLEKLDQLEKQRKDLEEREMLLRVAKSRSNKEDPEQLRLKQKAKELQQLELAQIQHRDANLTALAAIGPRKKRPLESGSGSEGLKDNLLASGTSSLTATKQLLRPRITRICLRDLIFCMEQEREMKYSRALYLALLK
ncbi:transcription initiation factor TFIID subunit 4B isoform X1 [Acinonyx jubatus]|uniref:Transcription initiation factor TFIID subunit 4B isoform X1 n=2 Tax=Acinonyx jubatus TaxID=32536 RepID=A0A6J2A3X9_ACIJB|nr:transcription initiation factor TFIID subunit 4B isoform X1 [Acinonyx jubatus]